MASIKHHQVTHLLACPLSHKIHLKILFPGRIRQVLRDNLKGTADILLPDVIHNRIQSVLKSSTNLNDTDLRKIRILYNMLKTAVKAEKETLQKKSMEKKVAQKKKKVNG